MIPKLSSHYFWIKNDSKLKLQQITNKSRHQIWEHQADTGSGECSRPDHVIKRLYGHLHLKQGWGAHVLFSIVLPSFGHTAHIYNLFIVVLLIKEFIDIDLRLESEYSRDSWCDVTRCYRKMWLVGISYF